MEDKMSIEKIIYINTVMMNPIPNSSQQPLLFTVENS